jgi:fructokinase
VTRGGEGLYAASANLELHRAAIPIDLVDTVGAGDSFTPASSTASGGPT